MEYRKSPTDWFIMLVLLIALFACLVQGVIKGQDEQVTTVIAAFAVVHAVMIAKWD